MDREHPQLHECRTGQAFCLEDTATATGRLHPTTPLTLARVLKTTTSRPLSVPLTGHPQSSFFNIAQMPGIIGHTLIGTFEFYCDKAKMDFLPITAHFGQYLIC